MKRLLITNPRFEGEAILTYNDVDILQVIDCSQTDMNPTTIMHFKKAVPVFLNEVATAFVSPTVVCESEIFVSFDMFWAAYKHKYNKDRCEGLWNRLTKSDQIQAYYRIDAYNKYLRKHPTQAKMHPDTWIRSKAWLNEYK